VDDHRRRRFEQEAVVHLRAVYNAAWRLARNEDDARDLSQETMLRAYRTFDGYTSGTNARAWLLTILYSTFVNRYHHRRRRPEHVALDALDPHAASALSSSDPVVNPFGGPWTDGEIASAMAGLPDLFREAILLVDVEELTYEEAAAAQGCAVGTVRSRLHRGRRLLAVALDDYARRHGLKAAGPEPL
jgi:RNA polymerase sigma-70 factor, ECF subfamily